MDTGKFLKINNTPDINTICIILMLWQFLIIMHLGQQNTSCKTLFPHSCQSKIVYVHIIKSGNNDAFLLSNDNQNEKSTVYGLLDDLVTITKKNK